MAAAIDAIPVGHPVNFEPPSRHIDDTLVTLPAFDELNDMVPILSRLPQRKEEAKDDDQVSSDDYLTLKSDKSIAGTLQGEERVLYTSSRLPNVSSASQAIWQALHDLRPLTSDYAGDFGSAPVRHSGCPFSRSARRSRSALDLVRGVFNWNDLRLPLDVEGTFYGVVFRSKRRDGSESTNLYSADKLSHEEAVTCGGLLMYWYGVPDPRTGSNLATCIWSSREEARIASRLPLHKEAALLARDAYQSFELSRYAVIKRQGETRLRLEEWMDSSA